jgi:hypothetical protein
MPILKYTSVSRTAARALEEFRTEFTDALVLAEPDLWSSRLGLIVQTDALKATFPIPIDAVGYHEFKGDMKYQSMYMRALSMKTKKWQGGVKELAEIIEAPDFINWAGKPGQFALEWRRHPDTLTAALLEANPVLDFYRNPDTGAPGTLTLFADAHPFNVLEPALGSFDNNRDTTSADIRSGKFFEDAAAYYAGIMGPNGKPLGLSLTGGSVLTSLKREQLFKKALEVDTLINAVDANGKPYATTGVVAAVSETNVHKGTVKRELSRELTALSDNYVYTFAAGNPAAYPFVVMLNPSPEEIVHDKNSDMYKTSLNIALSYIGDANVSAALPHTICRWNITA